MDNFFFKNQEILSKNYLFVKDDDDLRNQLCKKLITLNYETSIYSEYGMPDILKVTNPRKNAYNSVTIAFDKNCASTDVDEVIFNIKLIIGSVSTIKDIYVNAPFSSHICNDVRNILNKFNIPYTFSQRSDEENGILEILQSDISCRFGKFEILSKKIHFSTSKPFISSSNTNTLMMGYDYIGDYYGVYAEISISALIAAVIFGRVFEKYDDLEETAEKFLICMCSSFYDHVKKTELIKNILNNKFGTKNKKEKTINEVFDEFTDEQKNVVYAMIGMAMDKTDKLYNKNKKGPDFMDKNLNIGTRNKKVVGIKYVGYKGNKTTVVFDDDSTVTVRCRDGEQFDLYPAITYAFMERNLGLSKNKTHKLIQNLIDDADARKLKKLNAMSKKMKGAKSNEKTEKSNDEG